jgi:hypothetical protein
MFAKSQTEVKLDAEILSALEELANHKKTSEEYGAIVDRISKLHKLKAEEKPKRSVSPDTVLVVAANIFGILWLARYERENVIKAPNAFRNVMKVR